MLQCSINLQKILQHAINSTIHYKYTKCMVIILSIEKRPKVVEYIKAFYLLRYIFFFFNF